MEIKMTQIISVLRSFISSKESYSLLVEEVLTKEQVQDKKYDSEIYSFRHACVHWLPTDGFRHGSEPPLPLLINSGVQAVMKQDEPFLHLLLSYLALEEGTVRQIRAVIKDGSQPETDDLPETVDEFARFIEQMAKEVRDKIDPPWGDSRLRLVIGASMIGPPGEKQAEQYIEAENPVFTELMAIIEAVPPGDLFWDLLPEFFEKVEAVQAEKMLTTQTLEKLQTQLGLLHEKHHANLTEYFMLPIDAWQAAKASLEQIGPILDQLSGLITMLDNYKALTSAKPSTVKERQALREKQHRLEEQVGAAWKQLNEFFKEPEAPPTTDEETESEPVGQQKESAVKESSAEPVSAVQEMEDETPASLSATPPATETVVEVTKAPEDPEKPPPEPAWRDDRVLAMLGAGDLAGAYWLARSREHLEKESPIPSWLIGAMESSRYLLTPGFRLGKDFTYPIDYYLYNGNRCQELCALGVGLVSALVEPASNSALWLEPQTNLTHLQRIISAIRGFAKQGIQLNKRDLLAISSLERRNKMIVDAARRCQDLIQPRFRKYK